MNHIDELKTMTAEQLADWICDIADCVMCETIHNAKCRYHLHQEGKSCCQCWLDWLNTESERGKNEQDNSGR